MEERRAECKAHMDRTVNLEKKVFGNGQPGIAYEIISIKTTMKIILTLQVLQLGAFITYFFKG